VAKKEFIGITHEYDRLRLARLRTTKQGLELVEVETLDLPNPISTGIDQGMDLFDTLGDHDDLNIFEPEPQSGSQETGVNFLDDLDDPSPPPGESDTGLEDNFDMTKMDDNVEVSADNERVLADYFSREGKKKNYVGLHIPFGKTTFQFLKNVDPGKMGKNERLEFFSEKLSPISDREIIPDHYSWTKIGENNCLLAYNPDDSELINLIELTETYYNGKIHINELLPEEDIWAGLARVNYNIEEDDITGLIGLGESSSRIVFMKGQEIVNTLPIITEGENSDDILNTVFSKILFEIDKGNLPKITRLLVARSSKLKENIVSYLKKQFEDVEVDYLTPHPNNLTYADEILDSPVYLQPYMTAIGAAWAASKVNEKEFSRLSLLPEYILEKQRMLKLEWHGIAILVLIALTPLFINTIYNNKAQELQELERHNMVISNQIEDLRPIATMTEDLMNDLQEIQIENERILELANYSQQWSETLIKLNDGIRGISNLWLTSVRSSDEHVIMTGYSLNRRQIPMLAALFTDANIHQVNETEIREQNVYSFSMQINTIRQDLEEFLLDMPDVDFDSEFVDEIELDLSHVQQQGTSAEPEAAETTEQESTERHPAAQQQEEPQANDIVPSEEPVPHTAASAETTAEPEPAAENSEESITVNDEISKLEFGYTENLDESAYGLRGTEENILIDSYTIILHTFESRGLAESEAATLLSEGYKTTLWQDEVASGKKYWRVGVGQFETVLDALSAVHELPQSYTKNYFILRIR
jgi:hypothetical protein